MDVDSVKIKAPAEGHVQSKKRGHHTIDVILLTKSTLNYSLEPLGTFLSPHLASLCTGFLATNVREEQMLINLKATFSSDFFADQNTYEIKSKDGTTILKKHLIAARSRRCAIVSPYFLAENEKICPFPSFCCIACQNLRSSRKYQNELSKRDDEGAPIMKASNNIKFLTRDALELKSKKQASLIKYLRLHLYESNKHALEAARKRRDDPIYSILKAADNGHIKFLVENIVKAAKAGKLGENSFKYLFVENLIRNLSKHPSQHRFNDAIKNFFASLRITSGQKAVSILNNAFSISETTVNKHIKEEGLHLKPGFSTSALQLNAEMVCKVYETKIEYLKKIGAKGIDAGFNSSVAIDETGHLKGVIPFRMSPETLGLMGFCGCKINGEGGAKECLMGIDLPINTLDDVLIAFSSYKKSTTTSVLILCPHDPRLPCLVFGVAPTCMCFKKEDMQRVMVDIMRIVNHTFGKLFKHNSSGFATDGCLARVPVQWEEMAIYNNKWELRRDNKSSIFTVWNSCIGLGGLIVDDRVVGSIHAQDQLHCLKKFWQSIESLSRFIHINGLQIHASVVIKALRNKSSIFDFGNNKYVCTDKSLRALVSEKTATTKSDVFNKDPMNVRAVQQKISMETQEKLKRDNDATSQATVWYLQMMWYYRMIFLLF